MGHKLILLFFITTALFECIHGRQVRRRARARGNTFGGSDYPLNGPIRHETIELQQQQPYGNMMYSNQPQGGNYGSPYRPPQNQHFPGHSQGYRPPQDRYFQGQPQGGYRPPQGGYRPPQEGYHPQGQGHTNQGHYNQKNPLPEKPMYGPHKPVQMQPIDGGAHKGDVDNYKGSESGKHHTGDGYGAEGADSEYGSVDQNYNGDVGQGKSSYENADGSYEHKNEYVTNTHASYQPPKKKAPETFCKTGDIMQFYPVFCDEWLRPGDRCSVLCGAGSNQDSFVCLNHLNYGTCDAVCKPDGSWHVPCACNTATLEKKIRGAEQDDWYMEQCFVGDTCPNIGCGDNLCVKDEITCDAQNGLTGSCACQPLISERYNNINDDNFYICEGICVGEKCPTNELCEKNNVPTNNFFERDSVVCTLNGWTWEDSGDALPLPDEKDDDVTLCRPPQCVCKDDTRRIASSCNDGCGKPCGKLCNVGFFCDDDYNSDTYLQCIVPAVCSDDSLEQLEVCDELIRGDTSDGELVFEGGYLDTCNDSGNRTWGDTTNGVFYRYESENTSGKRRVGTCNTGPAVISDESPIVVVYECRRDGSIICVDFATKNCTGGQARVDFDAVPKSNYIILVKTEEMGKAVYDIEITADPAQCIDECFGTPSGEEPCVLCAPNPDGPFNCGCSTGDCNEMTGLCPPPNVCGVDSLSVELTLDSAMAGDTSNGMLVKSDGYLDICGDDADFDINANGLLYRFVSQNTETLRVGTCKGQNYPAIVAVYECGSSDSLSCVGIGDGNCAVQRSYVEFHADALTRYIILVKSKSGVDDVHFLIEIAAPNCLNSCPVSVSGSGDCILCDTDLPCNCDNGICDLVTGQCTNPCFSASSTVTVLHDSSTKTIRIDELKAGDLVMSVDNEGNVFFDEFYVEAHTFPETGSQSVITFTRFNFDDGYIDLSSTHIVYSSPTRLGVPNDNCIDYNGEKICAYVSNKLEVGDTLWTVIDGELIPKNISHISYTEDKIRAPKLLHGNIVVNGVVSSGHTAHHNAQQAVWSPWRFLYKIHPSIMDVKFLHLLWDFQIRRAPKILASKHDWFARHATEFVYSFYISAVGLITWVFYQVCAQKKKEVDI